MKGRTKILLLSLPLLGAAAADGDPLPVFPGSDCFPVSDGLTISGEDAWILMCRTGEEVGKVADFYRHDFKKRGLLPIEQKAGNGVVVSAFNKSVLEAATMSREGKFTQIILSALDKASPPPQDESVVPMFPGTDVFDEIVSRDGNQKSTNVRYMNEASLDENASFFQEEMRARGWKSAKNVKTEDPPGDMLEFSRPGKRLTVFLTSMDESGKPGRRYTLVNAMLSEKED